MPRWPSFLRRPARSAPAGGGRPERVSSADARRATTEHFREFVRTRVGVEAYLEPATNEIPTTLVLVATTGEWTRRRVPDEKAGRRLATELGIPCYEVRRTGYPQRMRDWNTRTRRG